MANTVAGPADRLTRRDQRELGILPRQLIGYGIRLKREGCDLNEIEDRLEQSYLLIGEAVSDHPAAWANPQAVDWDAILAFIEKLLPLILQIIAMF